MNINTSDILQDQYGWKIRSLSTHTKNQKENKHDKTFTFGFKFDETIQKDNRSFSQYSSTKKMFENQNIIKDLSTRPETTMIQKRSTRGNDTLLIPLTRNLRRLNNPREVSTSIDDQSSQRQHLPTNRDLDIQMQLLREQTENIEALMRNKFDTYFQNMIRISSLSVDINNMQLLEFFINNTAELMYEVRQIDFAAFFFNQARIFYSYTLNHKGKCQALQGLADCCTILHQSHAAIKYLKRALQYAWLINDQQNELNIYERMALNYFYIGQIEKSSFFHSRALLGGVEQISSPVKQMSHENIQDYTNTLSFTFTDITSLLLTYLNVPLFEMEEFEQQSSDILPNYINGKTPRALQDSIKNQMYNRAKAYDLVEYLLRVDTDFTASIPTPRFSGPVNFNFVQVKADVPPIVRMNRHHFTPSYFTKFKNAKDQTRILDQNILKLPLEQQVQLRVSSPPKQEDISQKIQEKIRMGKLNDMEVLRSPINLNHWMKEQTVYQRERNSRTFRLRLERIYEKNLQQWLQQKKS